MKKANDELKPCPFCGSPAKTFEHEVESFNYPSYTEQGICCSNIDCPIQPEAFGETLEEAAKAWNTRYNEGENNGEQRRISLKCCPLCGEKATLIKMRNGEYKITCLGACSIMVAAPTAQQAEFFWNRRMVSNERTEYVELEGEWRLNNDRQN